MVAVDLVANDKQARIEYQREPYTYFLEWGVDLSDRVRWHSYLNYNAPLSYVELQTEERFEYEKLTLQSDLYVKPTSQYSYYLSFALEQSNRELFRADNYAFFERDYVSLTFRFDRHLASGNALWFGFRVLQLDELDQQFAALDQRSELARKEWIVFSGWRWQVRPNQFFSPNLYIDPLDNWLIVDGDNARTVRNTETLVKLSLPYEWHFEKGLKLIINTTYEVDQNNFGGLNLQLDYQF